MKTIQCLVFFALATLASVAPAAADDWTAARLRGSVFANDIAAPTKWVKLARGAVVSDDRTISTLANGSVDFVRGSETVSFGPNTQARIVDRTGQSYTTVVQQSGSVTIAAEARRVQHFAVQTPYLVAVVKGTEFTVTTGTTGSTVAVARGLVGVTDLLSHRSVNVAAGQTANADAAGRLTLSGAANAALTHPVVNGVVEDSETAALLGQPGTDIPFGVALEATLGGAGDLVQGLTGLTGDVVTDTGGVLGSTLGSTGNLVGGTLGSAGLGGLGSTVDNTASSLGHTVTSATSTLGSTVSGVTSTVGGAVGGVSNTVHGLLSHL